VAGLHSTWWWGISPEGFGSVAMIVNFMVALTVNYFYPDPPNEVQELVEDIRIPRGAGAAHTH
ncbi:MAG: cation acetate symporter, partial [Flavobacteriaceae bacterium]